MIKGRAQRVRTLCHIARLLEPKSDVLFDYARFIQETPDYVLNQLLETILAKDRAFAIWRTEENDRSLVTAGASVRDRLGPPREAPQGARASSRERRRRLHD